MSEQLKCSVTHEVKIDGEKSWISLEYFSDFLEGETPERARQRVHAFVNAGVLRSIQETVDSVREVSK